MISTGSTYREKLDAAARAKIFWGDPREEAIKHLVENGIDSEEANGMVEAFVHERADTICKMGFKKILIGAVLVALPLAPWIILTIMVHRFFMPPIMILLLPGSVFVYGAYSLFPGSMMYMWPDNQTGDVSEID